MSRPDPCPTSAQAPIVDAMLGIWAENRAQSRIEIAGDSMLPLIRDGDSVLIEHCADSIRRGEIVVFWHSGAMAAHRVLHVQHDSAGPRFLTKGDHAWQPDPGFGSERVVGRVLGVDRAGRYLALDTRVWRTLGKLVAIWSLATVRLCDPGAAPGPKRPGTRSLRASALLRHGMHRGSLCLLKAFLAVFGRWQANSD